MKATLKTAPTVEPITLIEAFQQLRMYTPNQAPSANPDADYINGLIADARQYVENITNRALMTQTWEFFLDRFPAGDFIELPKPPLQSVTSLTYVDVDGNSATLSEGTEFTVDTDSEPGRIVLEYDETWPTDQLHPNNPITIELVAGYASADDVPANIKHAIKMLLATLNANRLPHSPQEQYEVPLGVDALLASYRVWSF